MIFEFKMAISGVIVALPSTFMFRSHGEYLERNPAKCTWYRKATQWLLEWAMSAAIIIAIVYVSLGLLHIVWGWR